jgi:hypothetical protein
MITYQGMTELPEATERRLCELTGGNLLALLNEKRSQSSKGSKPIIGASDSYVLIQEIAKRWDAAELERELVERYTFDPNAQPAAIAPAKPTLAVDVPRGPARPTLPPKPARTAPAGTASLTAGGKTTLQPTSKRSQIVAKLKLFGGTATIAELDVHFGEPTLPHLKKLMEAGWVNLA